MCHGDGSSVCHGDGSSDTFACSREQVEKLEFAAYPLIKNSPIPHTTIPATCLIDMDSL